MATPRTFFVSSARRAVLRRRVGAGPLDVSVPFHRLVTGIDL